MSTLSLSRTIDAAIVAPYITVWSTETEPPFEMVERPGGGIAYRDETLADRDRDGVLWLRTPFGLGQGRPEFGKVHPARQRRVMRRLLCQVCAGPADRTGDGVLWLLKDHREDWPSWPDGMAVTEPPVCVPCVGAAVRLCPALRRGATTVRARDFPVAGVYGELYRGGTTPVGAATVAYHDPAIRWVLAAALVRELKGCRLVPLP
jgi:hypothetical protein